MDAATRQRLVEQYQERLRGGGGSARGSDGCRPRSPAGAGEVDRARDRPSSRRQRDDLRDPPPTADRRGQPGDRRIRPGGIRAAAEVRPRPIAASLDAFKAARETTAEILDLLSEAEWAAYRHALASPAPYSVATWLEIYAAHAHGHAQQIRRARGQA